MPITSLPNSRSSTGLAAQPVPKTWWSRPVEGWQKQSITVRIAVVALGAALLVAVTWVRLSMAAQAAVPLYPFALGEEDRRIVEMLFSERGLAYQEEAGRVVVSPQQRAELTQWLAIQFGVPHADDEPLPPKSDWMPDPEADRVRQRIVQEKRLESMLRTLEFVRDCRVRIDLEATEEGLVTGAERHSRAAVTLSLKPGSTPSTAQVQGVASVVSASIPNLQARDVRVVDTQGIDLNPSSHTASTVTPNDQVALKSEIERQLTDKVRHALDAELGAANYTIMVNCDMSFDTKTIKTVELGDPQPASEQTSDEVYHGADPVTVTLDPSHPGHGSAYTKHTLHVVRHSGEVEKLVQVPSGTVSRITAALTVNQALSEAQVTAWKQSLSDGLGLDESRGDHATVRSAAFAPPAVPTNRGPVPEAPSPTSWPWLVPLLGGLGAAVGLVFLQRPSRRALTPELATPTRMLEPMSLADLLRSRDGQGTATSGATATVPRQALHDMAQQHPDRVAQHLLHTWLRPLP